MSDGAATEGIFKMKTWIAIAALALSLGACTARDQNTGAGALIGGATGAAIGGLATGRAGGAVAGGLIGAAGGAIIGNAATPRRGYYAEPVYAEPGYYEECPYGYQRNRYGETYCR